MSYDGLFAGVIARDLNEELSSARIEKVRQPEPDEIIMQLHCASGRKQLLISVASQSARVQLTKLSYENPSAAPAFCMLLRKHIQGGRISAVKQIETERIIEFYIDTVNEMGYSVNRKLIAETMGKHSNLILVDMETNKIIDSIKRISIDVNRYRQLLPGLAYVLPPSQGKLSLWDVKQEDIVSTIDKSPKEPSKALMEAVQGLGPTACEQLCSNGLSTTIARNVVGLRDDILNGGPLYPAVYMDSNGTPKDVHIFPLTYIEQGLEVKTFPTKEDALDFYYSHRQDSNRVMQKGENLFHTVKGISDKLLLKKQRLLEDIKEAEGADILRLKGELLNANIHMAKPGDETITVKSYYDDSLVTIQLDKRFSAAKNAQTYYKKYAKAKTSKKEKLIQLNDTKKDIAYIESVMSMIKLATTYEELELIRSELISQGYVRGRKAKDRVTKSKPRPHRFLICDDLEIAVGRSNTENDYVTFKLGQRTDMWFHTKDIPGSHVVLFTNGREPGEEAIFEAAAAAAFYSKAKDSENVPVDYTYIRHVKKPSGAKPGMVIFTNQRTVYVNPKQPEISL